MSLSCCHTPDIGFWLHAGQFNLGENHEELHDSIADATLGRPPLLPSQPHQPESCISSARSVSSSPMALMFVDPALAALIGWLVSMTHPAGRSFLLRAEGLRPRQSGDPRVQGGDQGRLQSAAARSCCMTIWALSPLVLYLDPTLFGLFEPCDLAGGFHAPGCQGLAGGRASAACCSAPSTCSSSATCETGLVWMTKILTDPFHDIRLYYKAPLLPAARRTDRPRPRSDRSGVSRSTPEGMIATEDGCGVHRGRFRMTISFRICRADRLVGEGSVAPPPAVLLHFLAPRPRSASATSAKSASV